MNPSTTAHQLTFVAISLSLHALFVMLGVTFPGMLFFIQLYLPLFSLVAIFMLGYRFQFVYVVSTFILSFLLFPDMTHLIFYILPSVILGSMLGILLKVKKNFFEISYIAIAIQAAIIALTIWLSNVLLETNILRIFYQLLDISLHPLLYRLNPLVIFIFAVIEVTITLLLIFPFLKRFQIIVHYQVPLTPLLYYSHLSLIVIGLVNIFIIPEISLIVLPLILFMTIYLYIYFFTRPTSTSSYLLLAALFLFPLVNAFVSSYLSQGLQILSVYFLALPPIFIHHKKSIRILNENVLI
jgi:hypothetical protein